MAALPQKRRYFLLGRHYFRNALVKILGSFHAVIIARGVKNVQQEKLMIIPINLYNPQVFLPDFLHPQCVHRFQFLSPPPLAK